MWSHSQPKWAFTLISHHQFYYIFFFLPLSRSLFSSCSIITSTPLIFLGEFYLISIHCTSFLCEMATSSMQIGMDSDWLKSIVMSHEDKVLAADYSLTSDELIACLTPMPATEKRLRPPPQEKQALKCPRCDSMNTKFCYYNNYSLSQPRYFCKTCRRYWTKGGSLRNVPVGGGCRRNNKCHPASATILVAAPVRHQLPPAVPLGGLNPVQLPNCLMNEGSLNIMDCSYNSGGLNLVMNHAKHEIGDMNALGLCIDRSRAALMVEPCQKLKFMLEDERWDHEVKSGDGSWSNVLSIGWQESVGYSNDHGSLSSSLGRI